MKLERKAYKQFRNEIAKIVNEFDLLNLMDEDIPEDEYDDLINPLISGLLKDEGGSQLEERLVRVLTEHYGVEPMPGYENDDIHDLVDKSINIRKYFERK